MNHRHRITAPPGNSARALLAVGLCCVVTVAGCAYYNTLYNAKARFHDAQNAQQPRDREGNVTRQTVANYDDVIAKCRKMIATWPDSRHVDDAMLLMARSYRETDRFEECVGVLDTLEIQFPKTELLAKAWALKGGALAAWGHYEQAVPVLEKCAKTYKPQPGLLHDLSTSLMALERTDEALHYLEILEKEFPKDEETLDARVSVAEILAEKGQFDRSAEVYSRLTTQRLPETMRYRVWTGYAGVELEKRQNQEALALIEQAQQLTLAPDQEPPVLLMKARAYEGADSTAAAIKTYEDVSSRFARGEYAAEANYHLGMIYEKQDSLTIAKKHFEEVPKAYANSRFARDAIKRGNNIARLLKLQETSDSNSPEAVALREFSLAELQLFQLEDAPKALESYQKLLADFPDTEYAPKAAYAIGYIYGVVLSDTTRAREAYDYLIARYPYSQQAANAGQFVAAVGVVPPPFVPPPAPAVTPQTVPVPSDTTATTTARPDTTRATTKARSDSTKAGSAPADTTETKPGEDD